MLNNEACRYLPRYEQNTVRGRAKHLFNKLTYNVWRRELRRFGRTQQERPLKIVDIGCGPGFLLGCFAGWFPDMVLTGVDQSEDLLAVAKKRCPKMIPLVGDVSSVPLPDGCADVAFALHVVEHLPQPDLLFTEVRRILRPGGLLVLATPNPEGLGARLMGKRWQGYEDPTHIALHGPSYWTERMKMAGFEIVRYGTTGLSGIPLFNRMPFGLIHWIPGFFFGYFSWNLGEACVCTAVRRPRTNAS
jgi:ubiquinone/menaquinone biosynthesis C-methylase UbiE